MNIDNEFENKGGSNAGGDNNESGVSGNPLEDS